MTKINVKKGKKSSNYAAMITIVNKTQKQSQNSIDSDSHCTVHSVKLGGCPFHGRVERDEIPTRESPPKQSGTLPCPSLPSTPLPSLPSACLLLCISMHTVCEVGKLNWIGPLCLAYPGVAVRQWRSRPSSRCYFNGPLLHSAYILHSKYCFS